MAERILFAMSVSLAIMVALFAAGVVREGARNMDELFHGVQVEQEESE